LAIDSETVLPKVRNVSSSLAIGFIGVAEAKEDEAQRLLLLGERDRQAGPVAPREQLGRHLPGGERRIGSVREEGDSRFRKSCSREVAKAVFMPV
jgi:hypothetical protein